MDDLVDIPECVRAATARYRWIQKKHGESGATVYRLDADGDAGRPTQPSLYLKFGAGKIAEDISAEASRLDWLAQLLPVPAVQLLFRSESRAWLLTTALEGENAYDALSSDPDGRSHIVRALAGFLRRVHALSAVDCPFNSDHDLRLNEARRNLDANCVDELDFDPRHQGWSAKQVWDEMLALFPITFERGVVHGDFSLGNIIIKNREVIGCIDVGRLGAADRYQDLAILWNNLEEFGADLQTMFLDAYGIEKLDEQRLQFHLCLDEFF